LEKEGASSEGGGRGYAGPAESWQRMQKNVTSQKGEEKKKTLTKIKKNRGRKKRVRRDCWGGVDLLGLKRGAGRDGKGSGAGGGAWCNEAGKYATKQRGRYGTGGAAAHGSQGKKTRAEVGRIGPGKGTRKSRH